MSDEEDTQSPMESLRETVDNMDEVGSWALCYTDGLGAPQYMWHITQDWGQASAVSCSARTVERHLLRMHRRGVYRSSGDELELIREDLSEMDERLQLLEEREGDE